MSAVTKGKTIIITGTSLTITDIVAIAMGNAMVQLDETLKKKVDASRALVDRIANEKVIYGVNTGFGPMADHIISPSQAEELQANLIKSHACGFGSALDSWNVLAAMVVRLNTLAQGYSGVRWKVLEVLTACINARVIPVVPRYGGVGASGDLIQLAHIAAGLMGLGDVFYNDKRMRACDALAVINVAPLTLKSKEGLALINGTSVMTGIGALLVDRARTAFAHAMGNGAMALELIEGYDDAIAPFIQDVRPHPGQRYVAAELRSLVAGSKLMRTRTMVQNEVTMDHNDVKKIERPVQDVYSFRCMPQIFGPVYETIEHAAEVIEREASSVTDNPIIDMDKEIFMHGGNFHGDYISLEMDKLKIVLTRIALTLERHINFFLNRNVNKFFPPFLNLRKGGLTLGLQGLQFVATSTTAELQSLCFPNYIHTIPTNGDNQDIVSMGTNSALLAAQVMDGLDVVLAIELLTLAQATDASVRVDKISPAGRARYDAFRKVFPAIIDDRDLSNELDAVVSFVRRNRHRS
ncbi:MAG: aromatic amino acid ammonia-lyase [bacterium]|nr:aromatic amino acid ammonia-lyase [bacterium]